MKLGFRLKMNAQSSRESNGLCISIGRSAVLFQRLREICRDIGSLRTLFLLIISVLSIISSQAEQGSANTRNPSQEATKIDVERELRDEYEQMNASFTDYYLILKGNETKEEVMQYVVEYLPEHFAAIVNADSGTFDAKNKNEEIIKKVMDRGEAWLDLERKGLTCFQDAVDNKFCGLANRWRALRDEYKNLMQEEDANKMIFLPWLSEMISYADFRAGDKPLGDILEALMIRFFPNEQSAFIRYFFCTILKKDMKYGDFVEKLYEALGNDAFVYEMVIKYSFVHQLSAQEKSKLRDYIDNHKKYQLSPQSVYRAAVLLAYTGRTYPTNWAAWKNGFELGKCLDYCEQTDFYNCIPMYDTRLWEYYRSADTLSRYRNYNRSTHDVAVPKIDFVDESSDKWSAVKDMYIPEMLQEFNVLFSMTVHEQYLRQVLHKESSEIKLLIDSVRQANVYVMSPDYSEIERALFYLQNAEIATRLFLFSHYGIIELSADDEKALYESLKNSTESEIYEILIGCTNYFDHCAESYSIINRTYYFPVCWEERMRGLTISKWASALKFKIQQVFNQKD